MYTKYIFLYSRNRMYLSKLGIIFIINRDNVAIDCSYMAPSVLQNLSLKGVGATGVSHRHSFLGLPALCRDSSRPTRIMHLAFRCTKLNSIYQTFSHVELTSTYKTFNGRWASLLQVVQFILNSNFLVFRVLNVVLFLIFLDSFRLAIRTYPLTMLECPF